ncbi:hypothetical protein SBADM41S_01842 [Streptomyces badius]
MPPVDAEPFAALVCGAAPAPKRLGGGAHARVGARRRRLADLPLFL